MKVLSVPAFWRRAALAGGTIVVLAGCGDRSASPPAAETTAAAGAAAPTGEQVYTHYCATCHMPDGGGVPNFQPALVGSPIVNGDVAKLETVIRAGSAALTERPSEYSAPMPPFGTLSDEEIKALVAYMRERFGRNGGDSPSLP